MVDALRSGRSVLRACEFDSHPRHHIAVLMRYK